MSRHNVFRRRGFRFFSPPDGPTLANRRRFLYFPRRFATVFFLDHVSSRCTAARLTRPPHTLTTPSVFARTRDTPCITVTRSLRATSFSRGGTPRRATSRARRRVRVYVACRRVTRGAPCVRATPSRTTRKNSESLTARNVRVGKG